MTTTSVKQFTEDVAVSKLFLSTSDSWLDAKAGIKLNEATGEFTGSILEAASEPALIQKIVARIGHVCEILVST